MFSKQTFRQMNRHGLELSRFRCFHDYPFYLSHFNSPWASHIAYLGVLSFNKQQQMDKQNSRAEEYQYPEKPPIFCLANLTILTFPKPLRATLRSIYTFTLLTWAWQ